ncbi:MAG: hypothetical protein LBR46_08645 [Prevotella sp.]|jgi:hypothetical protein|nr:hypothetical protein [Prevotella sp.]
MTTNNQIKPIPLEPKKDNQTQSFDPENLVHKIEYKQVIDIIKNLIDRRPYIPQNKIDIERGHNTITLSGSRGSGKTSFILSLKKAIELGKEKVLKDILFLDIIDPTLIEEKGHIFLNIVARVRSLVEDKELSPDSKTYTEWKETLKKLAAGLPMLDGIVGGLDPSDWNDTTFVMMDGLRRVDGANNLEWYFHQYIYQSLKILGKEYLIIAFDDIDTDFSKGWPVLETLRKYLTSPQIITFLSGDLDLYSFLVRKKQWKNFGKTLLKNEYDKGETNQIIYSNEYPELVEKLESQYMLKLLKPEYRITLSTIASKLRNYKLDVHIKNETSSAGSITETYTYYLKEIWSIRGLNTSSTYVSFFTNLPLRTQIALFNAFFIQDDRDETQKVKLDKIAKSMSDIFHSELRSTNVDVWELINGYGLTNIFLLHFLIDNKKLDEASQFYPKLSNPTFDSAVVALGAVLSERIYSSPFEIFDHFIRVSNVVKKADKWSLDKKVGIPNISDFVDHSRCMYDYGLKKIASLQGAYIASFEGEEDEVKNDGLISIKALQQKVKGKRDEKDLRIDELFDDTKPVEQILALLPVFAAQDIVGYNKTFYSFYNILAAIGDILFLKDDKEIRNEFVRIGQFREYPLFTNSNQRFNLGDPESKLENEDELEEGDDTLISENDTELTQEVSFNIENDSLEKNKNISSSSEDKPSPIDVFIKEIIKWKEKYNESPLIIPPYLLGRIMVRTDYSFAQISKKGTFGKLLHRQLIAFLNAILVEEVMENHGNSTLRLSNPTRSDRLFIDNYRLNTDKTHPLFDFIFSCPIITAYLNSDLFSKLRLDRSKTINIFSEISRETEQDNKADNSSTTKPYSFKKESRNARNDEKDANRIITHLLWRGITKETVNSTNLENAIKDLFKMFNANNKREKINEILKRVKRSTTW